MEMIDVESSNIAAWGYEPTTRELRVEFNNSALYSYANVPPEIADGMASAGSIGSYFSANIKNVYAYTRIA